MMLFKPVFLSKIAVLVPSVLAVPTASRLEFWLFVLNANLKLCNRVASNLKPKTGKKNMPSGLVLRALSLKVSAALVYGSVVTLAWPRATCNMF
jgi:hypothetical protein